jgi:hypothetical protein
MPDRRSPRAPRVDGVRARDWATVDFYAVLGVEPTASAEQIGLAFRRLAKRLHPDRVGGSEEEAEQFKSVTAAYDVLGNDRLRRSYDQVRIERLPAPSAPTATTIASPPAVAGSTRRAPVPPEVARRRGRRWLAAGIAVSLAGILVATLIVRLQLDEHARRAGRLETEAVLLVSPTRTDVRFTTGDGSVVQVPEPTPVNPGAQTDGQRVKVLYRADRPTDVLLDESTAARDITLWIVALKLLVGGPIFLAVGIRRLRSAARTRGAGVAKVGAV